MTETAPKSILYMTLGSPGAGKTFFARQFSAQYKLPLISADRLRFELFDKPVFSREEDNILLNVMDYMLEEFMRTGMSVVVDGLNSQRARRHKLREIARRNSAHPLIVWVQTDRDTAFDRASNRDRRQTDDKYTASIDEATFIRLENAVTKPQAEDYVVISGKHVFNSQLRAVANKINHIVQASVHDQIGIPKVSLGGRVDMDRRRPRFR